MTLLSVTQAATELGVSPRTVYGLAAPGGPIPCHRIGRRVLFQAQDIQNYLQACRFTQIKRAVVSSLSSTASLKVSESGLENYFRKRGLKPKLTPTTVKKADA